MLAGAIEPQVAFINAELVCPAARVMCRLRLVRELQLETVLQVLCAVQQLGYVRSVWHCGLFDGVKA